MFRQKPIFSTSWMSLALLLVEMMRPKYNWKVVGLAVIKVSK